LIARASGNDVFIVAVVGTWVLYCIYSWVVPPLVRSWLTRRRV
jgi:hypothetical protein